MSKRPPSDHELEYLEPEPEADAAVDAVLVHNLLRTHSYLQPCLDAGLREHQLTGAQFNAMLVLRAAGEAGLRMNEIGERLVVSRANVTGLVDRLERKGLVDRCDDHDRRATTVQLTAAGAELIEASRPAYDVLLGELTDCLNEVEKRQLVKLLSKLRRELRYHRRRDK